MTLIIALQLIFKVSRIIFRCSTVAVIRYHTNNTKHLKLQYISPVTWINQCISPFSLGTKHIDPDTGLIYFKYDFGYEFGVILPGEAKKVEKKPQVNGDHSTDIPITVIHEKSDASSSKTEKSIAKTNGHVHHLETGPRGSSATLPEPAESKGEAPGTDYISPQPSLQSDISETDREYQQYMGKMIPEFVPKKQAQFRPISGDPYSDSEAESEHHHLRRASPSKLTTDAACTVTTTATSPGAPTQVVGPKRFVPLVPGAAVQPRPQLSSPSQGPSSSPADALYKTSELGGTTGCYTTPATGCHATPARPVLYSYPVSCLQIN